MSNTNNNSISSIKPTKQNNFHAHAKNNFFNQKIQNFKPKTSLKKHPFNEKMNLYKKKNESQNYINSVKSKFPIDLLSKTKSHYGNYNNILKNNNSTKHHQSNNKKNKINNSQIKNNMFKNSNKININKSQNYKFSKTTKNKINQSNINNYINNSAFYANNNNKKSKNTNLINTNNYIINTLNVSEKNFLRTGIASAKPQKSVQKLNKDYENEINKLIKEKEECENTIKKQEKLIQRLKEDNEKLDNKITNIENENKKISKKIEIHQDNQEQLIMLVKIVQKSGVDVEQLIDKWNNEIEMDSFENEESNNYKNNNNDESLTDSINELNSKIDPSSFIPINIEEPHVNKKVMKGIPKLNFDAIKNGGEKQKKGKFRNHSK